MTAREDLRRLLAHEPGESLLVDLGTTTVTGVSALGAPELAERVGLVGHPVLQTLPLDAADTAALGSDFARTGLLFEPPVAVDDVFTDPYGVDWLLAEGSAAPLNHPLEDADVFAIARHPRPVWPDRIQRPETTGLVVVDAPTSGIVETCFSLRNSWQFLMDLTESWQAANALLDWALESVAAGYEQMLAALPVRPDVVLYGDDYGYQGGMFFSDEDFRTVIRPRLRTLFSRIRRATDAAICFHCCGAIRPILGDLADLGVEMLNLQGNAKGMGIDEVRRALPATTVLHGYTDLRQLGESVQAGDLRSVAILTDELLRSGAAIAAPVDNLPDVTALLQAATGASYLRALDADDLARLRRLGPVREVVERAVAAARAATPNAPAGRPPELSSTGPAPTPAAVPPERNQHVCPSR